MARIVFTLFLALLYGPVAILYFLAMGPGPRQIRSRHPRDRWA